MREGEAKAFNKTTLYKSVAVGVLDAGYENYNGNVGGEN